MRRVKHIFSVIMEQITGLFVPIINCLTAASIIKSILILLVSARILSADSGLYQIFYAVSDGFFYFLPFFLAYTASKQWNTDPVLSLLIPGAMLYPDIIASLEQGQTLSFLGLTVHPAIYHSSVIPVILAVGLLHFVEIPCDKYLPEAVRGFLKPILCCLIVLPVTFLVFGPMGTWIGDFMTELFFVIYEWNPVAAGFFMGFIIQPMVFIGAHWSIVPISIASISANGYDVIMPLLGGAVYGQCGAALAIGLLSRREKEKRRIAIQSAFSAGLGVTEPALFSVTAKEPRAMLAACIAGGIGGAMAGAAGTHCTSFAFPSIVTSVAYIGPGYGVFLLAMPVSFLIGFILTMLQGKKLQEKKLDKNVGKTD